MKDLKEVYIGLGGNVGNVIETLQQALEKLWMIPEVVDLKTSRFYRTTPVSDIPQDSYVNAVCSIKTSFTPLQLLQLLESIERDLGKEPKPKNYPRKIDLDILFFHDEVIEDEKLQIPHPKVYERLFVLIPLLDLTDEIYYPEGNQMKKLKLQTLLEDFKNMNHEHVEVISN